MYDYINNEPCSPRPISYVGDVDFDGSKYQEPDMYNCNECDETDCEFWRQFNELSKCAKCGKEFEDDELYLHENKFYCEKCLQIMESEG